MNYADFNTQPNGFPVESDATFGFMQTDYQSAIRGLATAFAGDGVIVSGCVETGNNVSNGWIFYGGDLVQFVGGTKTATFFIEEVKTQKANLNGALIDRYTVKRAKFGTGPGSATFDNLIRLESVFGLQSRMLDALTSEPNVLLTGCTVTNVNTGASTLQISAGSAIVNRRFVVAPAYNGGYPAYLNETGQWVNTPPTNSVRFDPYTAQRLPDVLRRRGTPIGEITMRAALTDRFDSTGLGRWEYSGWAICNGANGTVDLRSRFVVGYDNRNTDPGGNLWDAAYNTPGTTGGEKQHTLSIAEMPAHRHTTDPIAAGGAGLMRRSQNGEDVTASSPDAFGSGTEPDITATPVAIPLQGGGLAHENRPPFTVVVYIQRV